MRWALGTLFVAGGMGLRAWALRVLMKSGLTVRQWNRGEPLPEGFRLVRQGPYRFVKHPAYLGSMLIIAGAGILSLGLGGWVLGLAAWPFFADRICRENA